MANWSSCPRCGSCRIEQLSTKAFIITLLFGLGLLILLAAILRVFLIIIIPIMIFFSFIMYLAKETWECQDCKHKWLFKRTNNSSK